MTADLRVSEGEASLHPHPQDSDNHERVSPEASDPNPPLDTDLLMRTLQCPTWVEYRVQMTPVVVIAAWDTGVRKQQGMHSLYYIFYTRNGRR